jgi:rubrerythrin
MSITCPKCKKGIMTFYDMIEDEGFVNPKWTCNECGYTTINPDASYRQRRKK